MTRSDLRPIQYLVYSSRTGIVLPVAPWKIRRCKGLSDLPQGAKLVCRGAGTRSQVGLTPGFSLPLTLNLFLLWPRPSPSFPHWALADRGSPHLPPTTASSQEAWGLQLSHQLGRGDQMLGLKEEKKKRWTSPKPRVLLPVICLSAKLSGTEGVGTASPWFSWAS